MMTPEDRKHLREVLSEAIDVLKPGLCSIFVHNGDPAYNKAWKAFGDLKAAHEMTTSIEEEVRQRVLDDPSQISWERDVEQRLQALEGKLA
jgi:hypothetical protein